MVKHVNVSFLSWEKQVPSLVDGKRRNLARVSDFGPGLPSPKTQNHSRVMEPLFPQRSAIPDISVLPLKNQVMQWSTIGNISTKKGWGVQMNK